jgi:hypothetical protein
MFSQLQLIKESDTELVYIVDGQIVTCSYYTCLHNHTCFYFVYNNTAYIVKYHVFDRGCQNVIAYLSPQYSQVVYL